MVSPTTESPPLPHDLLVRAAEDIDIPRSRYESAAKHYEAVGRFLNEEGTSLQPYSPSIYPQGSIALGTAIKPLAGEEFDIDLACQLIYEGHRDPMDVRRCTAARLREHADYRRMLNEHKNRCLRLDYSDSEKFHLDIIAAKFAPKTSPTGTALLVPDREIRNWIHSDPKGYIAWFSEKKKVWMVKRGMTVLADVEPVPDQSDVRNKSPLQVAVQLLKRNRDVAFEQQPDLAPISVMITTLAAKVYRHEESIADALMGIVANMEYGFDSLSPYRVENPTNANENFADKWQEKPKLAEAFLWWLGRLRANMKALLESGDFQVSTRALERMVGAGTKDAALRSHADHLNTNLSRGSLYASTGTMGISTRRDSNSISVPKHTNYGV